MSQVTQRIKRQCLAYLGVALAFSCLPDSAPWYGRGACSFVDAWVVPTPLAIFDARQRRQRCQDIEYALRTSTDSAGTTRQPHLLKPCLRMFTDGENPSVEEESSTYEQSAEIVPSSCPSPADLLPAAPEKEPSAMEERTERSSEVFGGSVNNTERLISYLSNIKRVRRAIQRDDEEKPPGSVGISEALAKAPVHSLVHFLFGEEKVYHGSPPKSFSWKGAPVSEEKALSATIVQAVRLSASLNDYRLILRVMEAAFHHCTNRNNIITLEPQVLGEVVEQLAETSTSLAKIRKFWRRSQHHFQNGISSKEINSMLKVLGKRGKPGAAVQFLDSIHNSSLVDAYSFSIVLNVLRESIQETTKVATDQKPATNGGQAESLTQDDFAVDDQGQAESSWLSPCWQWNEGQALLRSCVLDESLHDNWNNHAFSSLLKLNQQASEAFPKGHQGPVLALKVLEVMQEHDIRPDEFTCASILSSLGREWKVALDLLKAMQNPDQDWYPKPNIYCYAAAASCCAKAREYESAMDLLQNLRMANSSVVPNTVVYNTVLQSLQGSSKRIAGSSDMLLRRGRKKRIGRKQKADTVYRLQTALELLSFMREDEAYSEWQSQPDRVTYNAILTVVADTAHTVSSNSPVWDQLEEQHPQDFAYGLTSWTKRERLVHTILDQMEELDILQDEESFQQSLLAVGSQGLVAVVQVVGRFMKDIRLSRNTRLLNTAISVLADSGDLGGIELIVERMKRMNCPLNSETISHVIRGMGNSGKTSSLPVFLLALNGNEDAARHIFEFHNLQFNFKLFPPPEAEHYSEAIAVSLIARDFGNARRILIQMQDMSVESSDKALEAIARSYALIAMKSARFGTDQCTAPAKQLSLGENDSSRSRADSAYAVLSEIDNPSTYLLSLTAKSCAANGLFGHSQELLRRIHSRMLEEVASRMSTERMLYNPDQWNEPSKRGIRKLHRSLLRFCALQGNVTAAMFFTEDIEYFHRKMTWGLHNEGDDSPMFSNEIEKSEPSLDGSSLVLRSVPTLADEDSLGMKGPEWMSLLIAASKSGHWRVCLTTLQFLRPYVEATNPNSAAAESASQKQIVFSYQQLAPALTYAVQCMAIRSQYAWIIRSVDDFITWSGRRPPKEAAAAAFRILCRRGRGSEVQHMLTRCLEPPISDENFDGTSYELSLFVSAITALHKAGLYNPADDVFLEAVSQGTLPLNLEKQTYGIERRFTLDLHGMNVAVANSAVRVALQQEVLSASYDAGDVWDKDMVIVTGRGTKSALRMRPVLRPEVQRMLTEEFYPPLTTISVPGNMGALRVPSDDISEWLAHQRQQKGAQMLAVAAVLKNLSTGKSLRVALTKKTTRGENAEPDGAEE